MEADNLPPIFWGHNVTKSQEPGFSPVKGGRWKVSRGDRENEIKVPTKT